MDIPKNILNNLFPKQQNILPEKDTEVKIKQWPDDPSELVQFNDIYTPFKSILEIGYRLIRNDLWSFNYDGFEIGKQEKKIFPNVKEQLSEIFLKREKDKNNQSLMDVVMRLIFLMGVEQGRRMAYQEQEPVRSLEKTLANYRERNKNTRYQLAKANSIIKIKEENPTLSSEEINKLVLIELEKTRKIRLEEIKKEIRMDPTLNIFKLKIKKKLKLSELLSLASTLDPEVIRLEDWINILTESGCSFSEWKSYSSKKNFNRFTGSL